ncbi:hypothetical protein [uncultured Methylophaga sp.]|uniref:DUF58 domain-containing protein n=1 Tax=uncultured Methylophaga sp. TaxID=285271 RepID=UPI002627EED4|nr:hypothetical protein [uncultured Methylophaga sp.]
MSQLFDYKTAALVSSLMPGGHKSRQRGPGSDFYRKTHFLDEPDPSRIDLNASLTDPFENLQVRSYRQRSKLDIVVLVDGSSSMLYDNKVALTTQLFDSICRSVEAAGDDMSAFFISDQLRPLDSTASLKKAFSSVTPEHNRASAYTDIQRTLPGRPSLIFLISDFHWPETQLHGLLTAMSAHRVVPVITWQSREYEDYPLWRFVEMTDLETGKSALVFVTRSQRQLLKKRYQQRREYLNTQCRAFNQRPFWLVDHYDAAQMNQYFATSA